MQDPVGPYKYKGFLCPPHLFCLQEKGFSFQDLLWVPKGRFKQLLREWGNAERNNTSGMEQGPGSSWGMCITSWYLSLSFSMELRSAPRWKMVNFRLSTHKWVPDRVESEDWWLIVLDYHPVASPPINQREVHSLQTTSRILPIQASSLKCSAEFGSFEHEPLVLAGPCRKSFFALNSKYLGRGGGGLTVARHTNVCLTTLFHYFYYFFLLESLFPLTLLNLIAFNLAFSLVSTASFLYHSF